MIMKILSITPRPAAAAAPQHAHGPYRHHQPLNVTALAGPAVVSGSA